MSLNRSDDRIAHSILSMTKMSIYSGSLDSRLSSILRTTYFLLTYSRVRPSVRLCAWLTWLFFRRTFSRIDISLQPLMTQNKYMRRIYSVWCTTGDKITRAYFTHSFRGVINQNCNCIICKKKLGRMSVSMKFSDTQKQAYGGSI